MPSKLRHNPLFIDLIIKTHLSLRWSIPFFIFHKIFRIDPRCSRELIFVFSKYFFFWLHPIMNRTVYNRRPCRRKLRYLGRYWAPEIEDDESYFKVGEIYSSKTFNSGTYTIEGYATEDGDKLIGYGYFEIVDSAYDRFLRKGSSCD